ncbi:general transcription factor 3C polypeptide 5 [Daktulosphaira vitifoliae]|uniref:general transcription factor 3C polypeptide 5 n=1 Tax=Daktulosphaira vitifoliae TaxID=58002 RepID=UPI0021AA9DCF|nr:general transcription factor 3C polypeptide 5 [Daktulosphaira vitifoliae]
MEKSNETDLSKSTKLKLLHCIIYPGIVNNVECALNKLGGLGEIANAFHHDDATLSVNLIKSEFGPALCGIKNYSRSLVVSMKTKCKVNKKTGVRTIVGVQSVNVIGVVQKTFKFTSMMDFVYLPTSPNCSELWRSKECLDMQWALNKDASLFLLPNKLSKHNEPQLDFYDLVNLKKLDMLSKKHRLRPYLRNFTKNNRFEDQDLPPVPIDLLKYCLTVKMFSPDEKRLIDRLFEKRPIWVKPALIHFVKVINKEKMKYLLPTTGYFTTTGPFRRMWVRHGYNYHNDPSNYIYQVIEIRNNWLDDHHPANPKKTKLKIQNYNPSSAEKQFYFTPNSIPLSIVANYQLCDIHLPEVQEMLKNPTLSTICSRNAGWLSKELIEDIRAVMYKYLENAWQKYLAGDISLSESEHTKLYNDYMEEDNLDNTRQKITKKLEEGLKQIGKDNEKLNDEFDTVVEDYKDKYDEWATLDRDELAKIIFADTRINKAEENNSNPCSEDEFDDFKIDTLNLSI